MALNNYFNQINLWTKITGAGAMCTDGSLCIASELPDRTALESDN